MQPATTTLRTLIAILTLVPGLPSAASAGPEFPGKAGLYAGKYVSHEFVVDDVPVTVVSPASPRKTASGYPWIWRAEFLGAFDGADRAARCGLASGLRLRA